MSAHFQAGIIAVVAGLAIIGADTLAQAGLFLGIAAVMAAVILVVGRIR